MDKERLIKHWEDSSDEDYKAVLSMFESKHYTWALFIGHLVIEKLFKALVIKENEEGFYVPKIHNLIRLAELANIKVDNPLRGKLSVINTFNMEARYAKHKADFYTLCTKEFTSEQLEIIKELRKWLKERLIQS